MGERDDTAKRFTGKLIIGHSITITIEYEYAKLIRHLRDRAIVRIFRSVDRRAGKIKFEDERDELAQKLVVMEQELEVDALIGQREVINIVWSTSGLELLFGKEVACSSTWMSMFRSPSRPGYVCAAWMSSPPRKTAQLNRTMTNCLIVLPHLGALSSLATLTSSSTRESDKRPARPSRA